MGLVGKAMKRSSNSSSSIPLVQYGALPYRRRRKVLEIMLVTSRGTGRWIIPKGWPKSRLAASQTAAEEAYEEAGVRGRVGESPIGAYSYRKAIKRGKRTVCQVEVFPLEVTGQSRKWPEREERRTEWFKIGKAMKVVKYNDLRDLIREFGEALPFAV